MSRNDDENYNISFVQYTLFTFTIAISIFMQFEVLPVKQISCIITNKMKMH